MPGRVCGGCGGSGGLQEGWLVTLSLWREGAACIHSLWETALGIIYGCDGEEQDGSPEGQCLLWDPSPQSFVWPFSSPSGEVRREHFFYYKH